MTSIVTPTRLFPPGYQGFGSGSIWRTRYRRWKVSSGSILRSCITAVEGIARVSLTLVRQVLLLSEAKQVLRE